MDPHEFPELQGKTVARVVADDVDGYIRLRVFFTDGTMLVAFEQSQAGWFHVGVASVA